MIKKTQAVKQSHDLAMLCRLSADDGMQNRRLMKSVPGVGPHIYKMQTLSIKRQEPRARLSGDQRLTVKRKVSVAEKPDLVGSRG